MIDVYANLRDDLTTKKVKIIEGILANQEAGEYCSTGETKVVDYFTQGFMWMKNLQMQANKRLALLDNKTKNAAK